MASLILKEQLNSNSNWATGWAHLHNRAIVEVNQISGRSHETAIVSMLKGWEQYAMDHKRRFDSPIDEDYVLGPAWKEIGESIRTLLNGEVGRLDAGTVDGFILDTMAENGFERE